MPTPTPADYYAPSGADLSAALMQGDILRDFPALDAVPRTRIHSVLPVARDNTAPSPNAEALYLSALPLLRRVAVVSHSCELQPENEAKVVSVLLAPIRDASRAVKPAQRAQLKDGNELRPASAGAEAQATFGKFFYLPPHADVTEDAEGAVIEFSRTFSLGRDAIEWAIQQRVLRLTNKARTLLGYKLAAFFYRGPQPEDRPAAAQATGTH